MKQFLLIIIRAIAAILLLAVIVITVFSVSPIYRFSRPRPFSGPDIYNPYEGLSGNWTRASFHTHTKVDNILNECPEYADVVLEDYRKFGYGIVAFSNHNLLTEHPSDSSLQINVYEHGYSIAKFHKLVFNPGRMHLFDHILPLLNSQKQWQYDYLGKDADFVMMNHPDRTLFTYPGTMRRLTGYRLIEGDCGYGTDMHFWDDALSAGHYSHNLLSDDCHDTRNHRKIARRCSWLDVPSARYEDIAPVLASGRFFSMRIPDFGNGDWDVKYKENASLPSITDIGVRSDSVYICLSAPARIEAWGQGHTLLAEATGDCLSYELGDGEPYVRFTAYFDNGVVIYSNAFARYDAAVADTPYLVSPHKVNVFLTILFNLGLLIALILELIALRFVVSHKKKETRPTVEQLRFRGIVP